MERILTLHPQGKSGVNISREKYDTVREAIVAALRDHKQLTFGDLTENVRQRLESHFEGSIPWYVTTVKLDLEARGVVERIPNAEPQTIRLGAGED
jgi:hypothetical protein